MNDKCPKCNRRLYEHGSNKAYTPEAYCMGTDTADCKLSTANARIAQLEGDCEGYREMLGICYKHISGRGDRFSECEKVPMLFRIKRRLLRKTNSRIFMVIGNTRTKHLEQIKEAMMDGRIVIADTTALENELNEYDPKKIANGAAFVPNEEVG
jgi:SepF-like predicted cell division protein (DUF552 family)